MHIVFHISKTNNKIQNLEKKIFIVISLILVFLIAGCDDTPPVPEELEYPVIEESDLIPIEKEPGEINTEERILYEQITNDFLDYATTTTLEGLKPSQEILDMVDDILKEVGEQGISVKGSGYSIAIKGDLSMEKIESGEATLGISLSLDSFSLGSFTFDGDVKITLTPNTEDGDFPVSIDDKGTKFTFSDGKTTESFDSIVTFYEYLGEKESSLSLDEKKAILEDVNSFIADFMKAINQTLESYAIETDALSIYLHLSLTDGGLDLNIDENESISVLIKDKLKAEAAVIIHTNKPIEHNGSKYKLGLVVKGLFQVENNSSDSSTEEEILKEQQFLVNLALNGNLFIETSGKVGDHRIRVEAVYEMESSEVTDLHLFGVFDDRVVNLLPELLK